MNSKFVRRRPYVKATTLERLYTNDHGDEKRNYVKLAQELMAEGYSDQEIAEELGIPKNHVSAYRSKTKRKPLSAREKWKLPK